MAISVTELSCVQPHPHQLTLSLFMPPLESSIIISINDHHAVTVPIYLCNCNLLPLSTSQQKQNPQQKKSQVNQQEQTEWMRPPFFLFYLRDIQPFINPVFLPFLLLSPLSVPHLRHLSTGWEKGRFVDYYKRSSIRGYPNLGETT